MTAIKSIIVFSLVLTACAKIDPAAELVEANASMAARDYRTAAIHLSNVLQAQPENADAHLLRGRLEATMGEYETAIAEFEKAKAFGSEPSLTTFELAEAISRRGDGARAMQTLETVGEELKDQPRYWQLRAEILVQTGQLDDAARALDRVAESGDTTPRYLVARAHLALANNAPAEAHSLFAEAVSLTPADPEASLAFGDALIRAGRLREAGVHLARAAEIYQADGRTTLEALVLVKLTQVHVATNDLEAAQSTTDRLAAMAPNASITAYVRGLLEYRRGRFDNAAAYLQQAVIAQPDNPQALTLLAAVQLALGNLGQAEQQLLTVLSTNPGDPAASKLLAEVRLRQARPEAALEALRPLAGTGIQDPKVGLLTGLANVSAGNPEEGLLYLEQAAALDPSDPVLRFELARAYSAMGRQEEAARALSVDLGTDGRADSLEARFAELLVLAGRNNPADGARAAAELVEASPRDPEALTAAALYYQMVNERVRARELLEAAVVLDGTFVTARTLLAGALTQEGRVQEAEAQLRQVVAIQPSNAQALTSLAQLAIERNDFDTAETLLRQSLDHSPGPLPRLMLARFYIGRGRLADANRFVAEAAAVAPDDPEVVVTQGLVALAEGRSREAAGLLADAHMRLGNRLGVVLALAEAQLQSGQGESARATLRGALDASPQSLPLRVALGTTQLRLGNVDDVSAIARGLQQEFPARSEGYLLAGEANIARRRYDLAVQDLRAAYEQEDSWRLLNRLVDAMRLAGRNDDMLVVLEDWSARHPDDAAARLALAGAFQAAGRDGDALRQYERVLQTQDDNVVALNNAAWLYHLAGDRRALPLAESAYRLAPQSAAVLDTLGTILLAENRDEDAVTYLERAAELAPDALEIRYHLAQAQVELRRPADARATLEGLLRDSRPFEQRALAEELLRSL